MPDPSTMTDEILPAYQTTVKMLDDLDNHNAVFARPRYASLISILSEPFCAESGLSKDEIYEILCEERWGQISDFPTVDGHKQRFEVLVEACRLWRERTGYQRPPIQLTMPKFPFIRETTAHIKERCAELGLEVWNADISGGCATILFKFPAVVYPLMLGSVEIRMKYDGDTRFSLSGGRGKNRQGLDILLDRYNVFGVTTYAKLTLQPPNGMVFKAEPNGDLAEVDNVIDILMGIISYYR